MKLILAIILPFVFFSSCVTTKNSQHRAIVVRDVAVIDVVTGSVLSNQTIIIQDDRITAMGSSLETKAPINSKIVEGKGKFVIPGLWDMHVHLEIAGKESLPFFIANGVTGVRDMGSNSFSLLKGWRQQIDSGLITGPHIIAPGPMLDGPFVTTHLRVTVNTDAEVRLAVDSLVALGVDFIKVHQQISKEAYLAVADQAKKHKKPFVGHLPVSITIKEAIEVGQKSIEHIFGVPDTVTIDYSMLSKSESYVTPTLVFIQQIAKYHELSDSNDPRYKTLSPSLKTFWKTQLSGWGESVDKAIDLMKMLLPAMLNRTQLLNKAGVQLLAGTDMAGVYIYPGSSLHEELELFVTTGLSPLEALRTATLNPARFLGMEQTMGSIQVGKKADLLILNTNPLLNISNTKDIYMVITNSFLYDRNKIKALQR